MIMYDHGKAIELCSMSIIYSYCELKYIAVTAYLLTAPTFTNQWEPSNVLLVPDSKLTL